MLILFFVFQIFASDKIDVLILHSYSQEYPWTKQQHIGFTSKMQDKDKTVNIHTEYLDTKRLTLTPKYVDTFIGYLKFKYENITPNLIYVTDDNALNFIYHNYSKLYPNATNIPIFFSGVNNLKMDTLLPKEQFRGVFEMKEIKPNIELIKQFSPQTRDVYIVGDHSRTYHAIEEEIQLQEKNFPNIQFHYFSDIQLSKLIERLPKNKKKFIILTTIGNFKHDNNLSMSPQETIKALKQVENSTILSMEDTYMYPGVLGGYVTSADKQGSEAAKLALQYLDEKSLKGISSIKSASNKYIFDAQEITNSRVLLSEYIRRISTILNTKKDFLEENRFIIVEALMFMFVLLSFIIAVFYAISRKKNQFQTNIIISTSDVKKKLLKQEAILNKIISQENLALWSLNLSSNELQLSNEFLKKLDIDLDIYKDDKDLISYFIHYDDKKLYFDSIQEVQKSHTQVHFEHRIIDAHNKVYNVTHHIYYEQSHNHSDANLIGILKFEV